MTKSNSKTPWVFRLGVALLCAMLITTHMMGNLYARYSTTATGGDGARVAKFKVDIAFNGDQNQSLSAYEYEKTDINYKISVSSNSEVAVSYDVILVFDKNFPTWIFDESNDSIKIDTNTANTVETAADGTKTYTFKNAGTLQPNETNEKEHSLHILMPNMANMNTHTYADVTGAKVTVIVRASQVD